jgi:hypothetical protein
LTTPGIGLMVMAVASSGDPSPGSLSDVAFKQAR